MSLLEEAQAAPRRMKGPPCDVLIAIGTKPELEAEIRELIASRTNQAKASATLARHGLHVAKHTIGRHRNNQCLNCLERGVWVELR